jgi:hypothetical protein
MYIGAPSVSGLHLFLCGYAFSRQEQGIENTAEEKAFEQFQPWIQQRFNTNASVSWAKIILLHSADERAGFELFFELWDEFIRQQRTPPEYSSEYERAIA